MSSAACLLASKFRGCLVGSHVGDCFGAPFEYTKFTDEELIDRVTKWSQDVKDAPTDLEKTGHTDDTAMTLCIADSLVENKGFAVNDMATRFVEEYEASPSIGYGHNVVNVFKALRDNSFEDPLGPAKLQFKGTGSFGNGAAMRVAPVALYTYNDEEENAMKVAKDQSLITHSNQIGYNGAILQCLAVRQALKANPDEGIDPIEFVDSLIERMEQFEEPLSITELAKEEKLRPYHFRLKTMREIFETSKCLSAKEIAKVLGNNVSGHKSVPTAIYSFLKSLQPSDDFEHPNQFVRAIYHAVSVAGDTDTIGAMTGSISGAYHGLEMIPQSFQRRCESVEKSERAADRLYELCCAS